MALGGLTRRRIAVTIVALFLLTPLIAGRAINSPRFQNQMLALLAEHTPWKIVAKSIQVSLWRSSITVVGLDMEQQKTHHHLQISHLKIKLNPWLATIAQLGVSDLDADGIVLDLSHGEPPGPKDSERLNWSRILLLKNLKISRALFTDITVLLPEGKRLHTNSLGLAFVPTLLRQINLTLNVRGTELRTGDATTATVDKFYLRGETNVSNWQDAAPYLNDIEGDLKIDDAILGDNTINYLRTKVDYKDLRFEMGKLDMLLNSQQITGDGFLDVKRQRYLAHVDIPQPIEFRGNWDTEGAISMGGTIQGKIHVEGEKFDPKEGSGKLDIAITQVPKKSLATSVPLQLSAKGHWDKGQLSIDPSTVKIQDGTIQLSGKVDLAPTQMNIPFTVHNVPVAPVFGRFNDDSFHPIAGVANGQGTIRGWGKTFVVDGVADVTNAAYIPMVVERAHVVVKATTDKLTLNGDVYQGGRASGRCDMSVTFSHQSGKGTDILDLKASLDRHNLAPTMKAFDWTGIATANYEIHGPTGRYTATGRATITDGQFVSIPYKSVTTSVRMIPRQVVFEGGTISIPRLPVTTLTQPITLHFSPGMFTFDGRPTPQLSLRGKYRYIGKLWQVDEIAYTDKQNSDWRLVISGTSANSNLNAHVRGVADAAFLNLMRETFRDVTGPATIDATLRGHTSNPAVVGTVTLRDNTLLLRASPYRAENLQGTLRFNGHDVRFENVRGNIEDGTFTVGGFARFERYSIGNFELKLDGKDIRYAAMGGALRLEMDTDLTWTGTPKRSLLSGDMIIQSGLYTRNFNIFDQLTGSRTPPVLPTESIESVASLGLNLRIRNNGEIRIRNNAANVALGASITVTGTEAKPNVVGIIQAEDGTLNYVGLRFNVARGLVEYRGNLDNPYIEFVGDRDIFSTADQNYLVTLTLSGPLNNLKYDLSSNPPQDRTSLISLLMTGSTPEEIRTRPGAGVSGSQYAAGQVGAVLAAPLASALYLDTVRLESGITTSLLNNTVSPATTPGAQRLYLGKRLSDRLNLAFSTDVGGTNPQQSIVAEYMLTDYLLIKGGQSSNQNFGFNFTLRFRERE
jgi:autotransporter translocation and assembly factor TamB